MQQRLHAAQVRKQLRMKERLTLPILATFLALDNMIYDVQSIPPFYLLFIYFLSTFYLLFIYFLSFKHVSSNWYNTAFIRYFSLGYELASNYISALRRIYIRLYQLIRHLKRCKH
jgi:hypothetical protein